MKENIICTPSDLDNDQELSNFVLVPISWIDPSYIEVPERIRLAALKKRYHEQLIADGLETGHFRINQNGTITFTSLLPLYSVVGYIFEAFAVRKFNEDMENIGKKALLWCTRRKKAKSDYVSQYKAIGTGFITTSMQFQQFYQVHSKFDVIFIRTNPKRGVDEPATILGTSIEAGIQIKAVRCNEKSEIVIPTLENRYSHVITFLRNQNGVHTVEVCRDIINEMFKAGKIGLSDKTRLEKSIVSPEYLGIDQREVDEYYTYIEAWYNGRVMADDIVREGVGLEIKATKHNQAALVPF